ncbi:unnamed protein product [Clonostachys rhizophaga]|uniref:Uncharacterized protein n=1 Tax=Clonostachys rhizophaga TaxID=160324 RepID=A0A9N9VFT7_9HYPO|nr:unnamed protein product [Clonostachys rhizophaga]
MVFDLLLLPFVDKAISGVKDVELVDILNVAFLEFGIDAKLPPDEVQGVQGLSLYLCDGWNIRTTRKRAEPYEVSSPVLERDSLGSSVTRV